MNNDPNYGTKPPEKAPVDMCCVIGFCLSLFSIITTLVFAFCVLYISMDSDKRSDRTWVVILIGLVSFIAIIAGLVFSIIGTKRTKKNNTGGHGLGVAGIVISITMKIINSIVGWLSTAFHAVLLLIVVFILGLFVSGKSDKSSSSSSSIKRDYDYAPTTAEIWPTEKDNEERSVTRFGNGGKKMDIWTMDGKLADYVAKYIELNPEFGEKYTIDVVCYFTETDYEVNLSNAMVCDCTPDIYSADANLVSKFTTGKYAKYAATYKELGIDVDTKVQEAEISQYIVDVGSRDGEVVALGYQSCSGLMIYRASIARKVFGTDDPAKIEKIMGAGTGDWTKFIEAAKNLKKAGYPAVSGYEDLMRPVFGASETTWVKDGKIVIDPVRESHLDYCKMFCENGWTNETAMRSYKWYQDIKADGSECFCFFGPASMLNDDIVPNQGDPEGEGDWRVCQAPTNFYWGGSWFFAGKNSECKEGAAELLEWITLDHSETGLQYLLATDKGNKIAGLIASVASSKVMSMVDGSLDVLGGQDIYPVLIKVNSSMSGNNHTQYDEEMVKYWNECIHNYLVGTYGKDKAIKVFITDTSFYIDFEN